MVKIELDQLLERSGRTYYWLATEAKINHGTMHKIRHNLIKEIKLDVIEKICAALECEPGELFVRIPDPKSPRKQSRHNG